MLEYFCKIAKWLQNMRAYKNYGQSGCKILVLNLSKRRVKKGAKTGSIVLKWTVQIRLAKNPGLAQVAQRLKQTSTGISHTIVNGTVLLNQDKPTGALPGRLVKGRAAC